ncbi:ricin B lectin domain-containing protein [Cristinia sonorae]|uniref:Ricin B lectin domain-containing protein n=1 Tax=Cristinia sonorae TaxID=1940300 RepID=A0A8K0XLC0_9AGAR|nr:ricin B lectin domain-containing protein [Cristinia sonorae]
MSIKNGATYVITNNANALAIDLSGEDNTSVILFEYHGNDNQRWVAEQAGGSWIFKSASSGQFISFSGGPFPRIPLVVGGGRPALWNVRFGGDGARVTSAQDPSLSLDTVDQGHAESGSNLALGPYMHAPWQSWLFKEVDE